MVLQSSTKKAFQGPVLKRDTEQTKTLRQMFNHLNNLIISLGTSKIETVSFSASRVACKLWTRSLKSSLVICAIKINNKNMRVIDHKFPI